VKGTAVYQFAVCKTLSKKLFCKQRSMGLWTVGRLRSGGLSPEMPEATMPRTRRPYPSDLTDKEWTLLKPLLASLERRGRPPKWPARHVADALHLRCKHSATGSICSRSVSRFLLRCS
jgi:hypothetical protein